MTPEVTSEASDSSDDDDGLSKNPYRSGSWRAEYRGVFDNTGNIEASSAVAQSVFFSIQIDAEACTRFGAYNGKREVTNMPAEIPCKLSRTQAADEGWDNGRGVLIHLHLPFVAGACNGGQAGMKWVALSERCVKSR